MPHREEVANAIVAQILERLLGMEVRPETTRRADGRLLDIFIPAHNAVLEAKYDNFGAAVEAAQKRWKTMKPAPKIVGALSYHPEFAKNIERAIRNDMPVEFALSGDILADWHLLKRTGTVFDLAQSLRRPAAILDPQKDEVAEAVELIESHINAFYEYNADNRGTLHKIAHVLQASSNGGEKKAIYEQSARVGGLILFGAMLFQIALAKKHDDVNRPKDVTELESEWRHILEEINYAAIFRVALQILEKCSFNKRDLEVLLSAAEQVEQIAEDGVDLMGRIYHRLLADAKPLGAFYTSIPAATLIAGLSLPSEDWGTNEEWADLDFIKKFRIADPACGSGTLLAAACWQMRDNFSRADAKVNGIKIGGRLSETKLMDLLQKSFLEEIIWGYDVLETAGHLTAMTLGLMAPDVDFRKAHIYRTIIGKTSLGAAAGSLEWLEGTPIFNRDRQVEEQNSAAEAPELLDLCIMNPPFVRGTLGHESFSFLPPIEREAVHNRIRELGRRHRFVGDKGQGAAFVALACQQERREFKIKEGGRIALILPSTFAVGMGKAWSGARAKIEKHFDLETLIVSREEHRPNFSENTNLQECIVIARKRKNGCKPNKKALFAVLSRNPKTAEEAHATTRAIRLAQKSGEDVGDLRANGGTAENIIGQYAFLPWHGKSAWRGISFANLYLSLVAETFSATGCLHPFAAKGRAPLTQLQNMANFGSHRLDLYLNDRTVKNRRCRISPTPTAYAGYFPGHYKTKAGVSQKDLRNIAENPQCYTVPFPKHQKWADAFWNKAGRIAICQSFGFNTMRRLAVLVSKPVQASHYWPVSLHNETEQRLKALALWLNSTPSLLLIANLAQSTYGSKVGFSQKAAKELPVFNLDELTKPQLKKLAALFDKTAKGEGFLPIPRMAHDPVRKEIDDAFSQICGFGDLLPLRAALAAEPIITNQPAGVAAD